MEGERGPRLGKKGEALGSFVVVIIILKNSFIVLTEYLLFDLKIFLICKKTLLRFTVSPCLKSRSSGLR